MQVRLETRPDGQQRVITDGLRPYDQQECALELLGGVTEEDGARVLRYISDYVTKSQQHILAGETMRYGWSTLHFAQDPGTDVLSVEELAAPFATANDTYKRGAAKALAILREQDATVRRNGVASPGHHPHRSERAVICRRMNPNAQWPLMVFDRIKARQADQSGWFVGCGNAHHNHNDVGELAALHLVYLAERDPRVVNYLAMPENTRIVFERDKIIVFGPGQQDGHIDLPEATAPRQL
jgi:hypothetical protein